MRETGLPGCTEDPHNPLCADMVKQRGRPSSPAEVHDPPNAAHFSVVPPVLVTPQPKNYVVSASYLELCYYYKSHRKYLRFPIVLGVPCERVV